ncbi:MAG: DEAD/DEAH box helicase [Clostridia bacterium]|nr:DEAD/DEAH box helicase [Deltaproteobacteria bacterium]
MPYLRLSAEKVMNSDGEESILAMCTLSFDYGRNRVRCSDRRATYTREGTQLAQRNRDAENRARHILENFGLIELDCLEEYGRLVATGDYIVDMEGNIDALASFSAAILPRLEQLGWTVDVDTKYPVQTTSPDTGWYAKADSEGPGWFQLELGVDVSGQRINLLPVLVDLIEKDGERLSLESLAKHRHRFVAVPLGGTKYMPVPPERVAQIVRVLLELLDAAPLKDDILRLPKGRIPVIDQLSLCLDGLDLEVDAKLAFRAGPATIAKRQMIPASLKASLRPYQVEGLAFLEEAVERGTGVILADDMGLGKTLQTIAHIVLQKERGKLDLPVLVVGPTSLVGNWEREIAKFAPSLKTAVWSGAKRMKTRGDLAMADVIITSYPLLVRDTEVFDSIAFHLLILDEAQAVKSARSLAHQAVKKVITRHRLCLSGTPVENGLSELWSIFDVLTPGWLGSSESFRTTFAYPIEKLRNDHVLAALRERIKPFILRRMKSEVARDLPPKTELVKTVELEGAQRDLYESIRIAAHDQVRRAVKDRGVSGAAIDILGALLKLRQVCCDPRLVNVPSARLVKESAKLATLHEMIDENRSRGQRVLVFSQFATMLALIAKDLVEKNIPHCMLTGATLDRQKLVEEFQAGQHDVFLISLKAGGTGLTLTAAETVIHYDPWWNPAIQAQATDRAYRIGQTKPVFAFNLVAAGSVEERILALQRKKRELADGILGSGTLAGLSPGELDSLFDPLDA